jgi:hypothetical protein
MIATMNSKFPIIIGKFTFFNIFHMGAIYTNWNIMFAFASNGTGVATDA